MPVEQVFYGADWCSGMTSFGDGGASIVPSTRASYWPLVVTWRCFLLIGVDGARRLPWLAIMVLAIAGAVALVLLSGGPADAAAAVISYVGGTTRSV